MDERMRYDGRRLPPRNSRGEFRRRRRGDRGMDYEGDMQYRRSGGRSRMEHHRQGGYDNRDMRYDYGHGESREYYPIEAMGIFNGYYGMGNGDYRRGGGRYDYGYDYGYEDYGDYGETLTEEDLEHWNKRLMHELDDREKQMFHKDTVIQRAKAMGQKMQGFGEKELYTTTLMMYTDYKKTIGQNVDLAVKLAFDWLNDDDVAVNGAEKLAVYYDCIVEGE